jgi:hypothetical protein
VDSPHSTSCNALMLRFRPQVVVVTHQYPSCVGVRCTLGGVKVYYAPVAPFTQGVAFPTFTSFFAAFRTILIRERVTIVHGHQVCWWLGRGPLLRSSVGCCVCINQATSTMANECILHARTMGIKVSGLRRVAAAARSPVISRVAVRVHRSLHVWLQRHRKVSFCRVADRSGCRAYLR